MNSHSEYDPDDNFARSFGPDAAIDEDAAVEALAWQLLLLINPGDEDAAMQQFAACRDALDGGIDPVEAMVEKARAHCAALPNVEVILDDALTHPFEKADLFVSYYCIQFVQPRHRQDLINRIYERLHWGGALIMFEKVRGPDARFQDMSVALYNDFKARNGFTALHSAFDLSFSAAAACAARLAAGMAWSAMRTVINVGPMASSSASALRRPSKTGGRFGSLSSSSAARLRLPSPTLSA